MCCLVLLITCPLRFAPGIAFSEGQTWKDIRKFEIMALKDFGRGKFRLVDYQAPYFLVTLIWFRFIGRIEQAISS